MTDQSKPPSLAPPDAETLLRRYGPFLEETGPDPSPDPGNAQILAMLWHVILPFVEHGFSVKPGDKLHEGAELGMDDVLYSILSAGACAEADKPNNPNKKGPE